MGYERWDNKTLNLTDAFDDEAEALAAVRDVILRDGPSAIANWALDRVDGASPPLGRQDAGRPRPGQTPRPEGWLLRDLCPPLCQRRAFCCLIAVGPC
ncbi:MAG TPA: hypothetical protein VKV26_02830 [Dehalococcoidia bacterium]|nr:hypothetical protein [Dehalococcoidia bacterium]